MLEPVFSKPYVYNFIKKRLQHSCFAVNIRKFLKASILKNIFERVLLILTRSTLMVIFTFAGFYESFFFFFFFAFHVHTGKSIYHHLTLLYLNILVNGWNFPKRFRKRNSCKTSSSFYMAK